MNLAQQIEDLRRQFHAQRAHSDRLIDAVFRQLQLHAEATRNLHAAFGHLIEQPMPRQQRDLAQEINEFRQRKYSERWGHYADPYGYEGEGYQ